MKALRRRYGHAITRGRRVVLEAAEHRISGSSYELQGEIRDADTGALLKRSDLTFSWPGGRAAALDSVRSIARQRGYVIVGEA